MINAILTFIVGLVSGYMLGGWAVWYTEKKVREHVGE